MSTEIPMKALTAENAPTPEKVLETDPFLAQMLRNKALQDAVESAEGRNEEDQHMNQDQIVRMFRRLCNIAAHKAKALELREQHIFQRLEDGSYTMTIRMIPKTAQSDIGGVDGIIVHKSRGIVGH